MITYHISSKELAELQKSLTSSDLKNEVALAAGRGAANLVRNHLLDFDSSHPNKLGGTRTHFYAGAADSISEPQLSGGTVSFSISKLGLAQRFYGGPIHAGVGISSVTGQPTKYLAIPACSGAYGLPPGTFSDLRFIPRRNGHAMLVKPLQQATPDGKRKMTRRSSKAGGIVMYWLTKSVEQAGDPTVLPAAEDLQESAVAEAGRYLSERLQS